jgi:hypothetical protein
MLTVNLSDSLSIALVSFGHCRRGVFADGGAVLWHRRDKRISWSSSTIQILSDHGTEGQKRMLYYQVAANAPRITRVKFFMTFYLG